LAVQRHIHLPFVSGLLSRLGFPEDCDPIDHVAHLPCPVLFLHGTRDPIVPSEMSEALHARAPEPKSLVMLPGHGHCKGSPERERRVRDTVAEYLREQFTRPA
jgi:hypothetical protein